MKTISPQPDLAGMSEVFNLAGETLKQAEPKPAARPDNTRPLFNEPCREELTFDGEASFSDDRR